MDAGKGLMSSWDLAACVKISVQGKKILRIWTNFCESFAVYLRLPVVNNQETTMNIILPTRMEQYKTVAYIITYFGCNLLNSEITRS